MAETRPAASVKFDAATFDATCDVLVIGAGAAGLVAALRASEAGADVLVLERDAVPRGSTALSAGLIPAAGTRFQAQAGIIDSEAMFCADIMAKAQNEPDAAAVATVVRAIGPTLEWLADAHGLPFSVIGNFSYPGHSALRMHGLPTRSGVELMDRLRGAAEAKGIDIVTSAHADTLFADDHGRIHGVGVTRPDGTGDRIGCRQLVLACNGYGGHAQLVSDLIPAMRGALYFGHSGNQGDALFWGQALGAGIRHLSGYQGHGSVAHPHGVLITWATITEGGFQINAAGQRFANEARGYSEAAASVLAQPGAVAWTVFDTRIAGIARQFEDFRNAESMGAIIEAASLPDLAAAMAVPLAALAANFAEVERLQASPSGEEASRDRWGRRWAGSKPLAPPFCAVRVTGALFHTQGGLVVDAQARVLDRAGQPLPNLFAAGGAAAGVSGDMASGYLSGNGLLTAMAYGSLAGESAAKRARQNL